MNQIYPETEPTIEALEGDASHQIGAELINAFRTGRELTWSHFDNGFADNGVLFDEHMFDSAREYGRDVESIMQETSVYGSDYLSVEQQIILAVVHPEQFGTPDCWIYNAVTGELYIWDYKYGFDVVEEFENWQMINYVKGIIALLKLDAEAINKLTVHIRVVQPRAFHRRGIIREWSIAAVDLRPYFNSLHANAHEALSDRATMRTGNHCKHCPGRHDCPAALEAGTSLYEAATLSMPQTMTNQALGTQLTIVERAIKSLEYLQTGYKAQVSTLVKQGKPVPGWSSEPTFGRLNWKKELYSEVVAMLSMYGIDVKTQPFPTPKQAIKLGVDESVTKEYSEIPRNGLAIVADDGTKARRVFS